MAGLLRGLALAHLGQGIAVENEADGGIVLCQTRRKLDTVAVGDKVLFAPVNGGQGRIEEILPRRSALLRPAKNGRTRAVAANLDAVFVVFAAEPLCDFLLLDQYLAVCENSNIGVSLVFNKIDLPEPEHIGQELATYEDLGYPLYRASAVAAIGLADLMDALAGRVSMFTGQSGVGKSSLTNALIPDKQLKTNTISATTKHGRHTTTAATLYHLEQGGDLIDSPGVAIFGLADLSLPQLALGYREFQPLLGQCQFNDCRHVQDKGCAIREAAEQGRISASRYQRYLKLIGKMSAAVN